MKNVVSSSVKIHNSKRDKLVIINRVQNNDYKPVGLWYGIDNEWLNWCKSEMPNWIHPYNYVLELNKAKMVIITNLAQFDQFHNEYKRSILGSRYICYIDWERVALKYGGIEINPYLWERRLPVECIWYYGWDCASGCIWNKEVVLKIKKISKKRR